MIVPPTRAESLRRLDGGKFDLLVVGGGATGAAVARDAALRGFQVALVDAGDFAGETSSHSSKLIHGGLRYLQYGDFALVFEALSERRRLMKLAPHLCRPIDFIFPAYRGLSPRLNVLGAGIAMYNALALWRPPVGGRRLSRAEVAQFSPALRQEGLQGAQLYVDCQTDDARLVLETVLDAVTVDALAVPYVKVTELLRDRRGRAQGARVVDKLTGAEMVVEATVIVNATGPFSDAFDRGRNNLRPTLGVHLVFDAERVPHGGRALVMRSPRDGRLVFLLPAGARTIVGTTDTDWLPPGGDGTLRPPRAGDIVAARCPDIDYLLEVVNASLPAMKVQPSDVLSTFAGLRPLVAVAAHSVSSTSREHELLLERDGLLTIVGGKLTTHRRMAEEVVDRVVELARDRGFENALRPCATGSRPLPGGTAAADQFRLTGLEVAPDVERHLRNTYGARLQGLVSQIRQGWTRPTPSNPSTGGGRAEEIGAVTSPIDLASRLDPELPFLWAEVIHAARAELVTEIEDVLRRRIPLFRDARDQGLAVAPRVGDLLRDLLGWSAARRAQSLARYIAAVEASRAWSKGDNSTAQD